jgi:hypothetical protein
MLAHRFTITVEDDHQLRLDLPSDFPSGPAEVIVLAEGSEPRNVVRLGGVLQHEGKLPAGDPIAEALTEVRAERDEQLEQRARRYEPGSRGDS